MRIVPWFWTLANFIASLWLRVRLKQSVGVEGAVPEGAVLLCAKHATAFDIPLLTGLCRRLRRSRPYFQMGSFVGYPVFGRLVPFLRRLGGFCVMRPKEVLRLRHRKGFDRESALEHMNAVNQGAERTRRELLREGQVLVVFPEGTRDDQAVRPLVAELEVRSALAVRAEGVELWIWPVTLSFGRGRFFRRRVAVRFHPPFDPGVLDAGAVLEKITEEFARHWSPPAVVDSGDPGRRGGAADESQSAHVHRT